MSHELRLAVEAFGMTRGGLPESRALKHDDELLSAKGL
jgi:hypothetical protein